MKSAKRRISLKIFLFLVFTDLLEVFIQFCFKKSALTGEHISINGMTAVSLFIKTIVLSPFLWMAFCAVLVIFVTWAVILSRIDLSVAAPVASFSYIGVPIVAMVFLHETISRLRWAGIAFILIGVVLVSLSTMERRPAS